MKKLFKGLWEHLKTKNKYNKKCIEVDMLKQDIQNLIIAKHQQKNTFELEKEVLEQEIVELQSTIVDLKKALSKSKSKSKKVEK